MKFMKFFSPKESVIFVELSRKYTERVAIIRKLQFYNIIHTHMQKLKKSWNFNKYQDRKTNSKRSMFIQKLNFWKICVKRSLDWFFSKMFKKINYNLYNDIGNTKT